jgi:hypothetical protein
MGDVTIFSATYYSQFTIGGVPSGWNKQANSINNPVYGASNYAEQGGPIDDEFQPSEVINPDYSGSDASYLGKIEFGGRDFYFIQDQFGFLLGTAEVNLAYSEFPNSIDPTDVLAENLPGCFLAGTQILTRHGAQTVENLQIGTPIVTPTGGTVIIKWIGRQTLSKWRHGPHMQPVRIRAGALGDGLPHSDLTVTADHGMVLDLSSNEAIGNNPVGCVINASALVNGTTIDFVPISELDDSFIVYHIETENHDVILANGAPSETYIDYRDRRAFDNYQEFLDLYGAERIIPEMALPRISSARHLPLDLRRRLGTLTAA